jgi:hypothetical protein
MGFDSQHLQIISLVACPTVSRIMYMYKSPGDSLHLDPNLLQKRGQLTITLLVRGVILNVTNYNWSASVAGWTEKFVE